MLRRLALALLALALLAGWQEALLHPLEHVNKHGGLVHLAHSHPDPQQNENSSDPADKLCSALAALTACAPEVAAWGLVDSGHVAPFPQYGVPRVAEAPPFFAQGPPALL